LFCLSSGEEDTPTERVSTGLSQESYYQATDTNNLPKSHTVQKLLQSDGGKSSLDKVQHNFLTLCCTKPSHDLIYNTGYTQKNCAVSEVNKKFISQLTRDDFDYRIDLCRVTKGAHIGGF
jgi:hypothetical protein